MCVSREHARVASTVFLMFATECLCKSTTYQCILNFLGHSTLLDIQFYIFVHVIALEYIKETNHDEVLQSIISTQLIV